MKFHDTLRGLPTFPPSIFFAAMTLDDIRNVLHGTAPFTVRMVSGRAIEVPHPDFVALNRERTSLLISEGRGRIELVQINQIESLEKAEDATNS